MSRGSQAAGFTNSAGEDEEIPQVALGGNPPKTQRLISPNLGLRSKSDRKTVGEEVGSQLQI